jgi:hypothetical protein
MIFLLKKCPPAAMYLILSILILVINIGYGFYKKQYPSFTQVSSGSSSICLISLIMSGMCIYDMSMAWAGFMLCSCSLSCALAANIYRLNNPAPPTQQTQ